MNGMEPTTTTSPRHHVARRAALSLALVGLLGLASCGSAESSTTSADSADTTVAVSTDSPVITGAWARTSPTMVTMGAAYFSVTSPIDDRLIGVRVDASVAATAEMHEMVMASDDTMTSHSMDMGSETTMAGMGEMTMQQVDHIDLPAGTAVALAPGGLHVMLIDLVAPLEAGSTIQLTLEFAQAGTITIDVPVLDEAPTS